MKKLEYLVTEWERGVDTAAKKSVIRVRVGTDEVVRKGGESDYLFTIRAMRLITRHWNLDLSSKPVEP